MNEELESLAEWLREFTRTEEWTNPPYASEKPLLGPTEREMARVAPTLVLRKGDRDKQVTACFKHLGLGSRASLRVVAAKRGAVISYRLDLLLGFDQRPDRNTKTALAWIDAAMALGDATANLTVEDRRRLRRLEKLDLPELDEGPPFTLITPPEAQALAEG